MNEFTDSEYAAISGGVTREPRRCPNPHCRAGMDISRNIGRLLTVRPVCTVCRGLGSVLVASRTAA